MIMRERLEKRCQRQSRASLKTPRCHQRFFYIVVLLCVALLLLMPLLFHSAKLTPSQTRSKAPNRHYYHSALAANMARIAQFRLISQVPAESNRLVVDAKQSQRVNNIRFRQNAPTRMSVAGIDHPVGPLSTLPSSKGFGLLDKSPYANFANQTTHSESVSAVKLAHPDAMIPQGEFIFAVLESAIDSDLPGMIRAVITRPVYSYVGEHLLIPAGSRLMGQYSSKTLLGIDRVMVVWQRVLLPNGVSIQIDSPGADALGQSGLGADHVNTHFFQRFGNASLLSLIGAGVANGGDNEGNNNASQQYRTAIAQSFQSSAHHSLDHRGAIKPSMRIDQGAHVIVFVAKDLDFFSARKP